MQHRGSCPDRRRHANEHQSIRAHQRDRIVGTFRHRPVEVLEIARVDRNRNHAVERAIGTGAPACEAEIRLLVDATDVRRADVQSALLTQVFVEGPPGHVGRRQRKDQAAVAIATGGADHKYRVDVVCVRTQPLEELMECRGRVISLHPHDEM